MERRAGLNSTAPFALGLGAAFAFWHRSEGWFRHPSARCAAWLTVNGISSTIALHMEN
jgi:hypothetical protein